MRVNTQNFAHYSAYKVKKRQGTAGVWRYRGGSSLTGDPGGVVINRKITTDSSDIRTDKSATEEETSQPIYENRKCTYEQGVTVPIKSGWKRSSRRIVV